MPSYINPKLIIISDPVGLDLQIVKCQARLAAISWMQLVYGRAAVQFEDRQLPGKATTTRVSFPEIWGRSREPESAMPNDNLKSYAFFVTRDASTFDNYDPGDTQLLTTQGASAIVWADLSKVNPTRKDRFGEELKQDVLKQLSKVPGLKFKSIIEQVDRVFDPFTITDVYRQYLKPPFWAMRVDFSLSFALLPEECPQISTDVPPNALLNEDGTPILMENGAFIIME